MCTDTAVCTVLETPLNKSKEIWIWLLVCVIFLDNITFINRRAIIIINSSCWDNRKGNDRAARKILFFLCAEDGSDGWENQQEFYLSNCLCFVLIDLSVLQDPGSKARASDSVYCLGNFKMKQKHADKWKEGQRLSVGFLCFCPFSCVLTKAPQLQQHCRKNLCEVSLKITPFKARLYPCSLIIPSQNTCHLVEGRVVVHLME